MRKYKVSVFAFALLLLAGCGGQNNNPAKWDQRVQSAPLTDPYQIKKESESNEVRTKQKYDGKYLFIMGFVSSIKEDSFWLERGFARGLTGNDDAVKCEIRSSDRRFISRLNKGDEVVAFGRYKYNDFMGLRGELSDCVWSARTMKSKNWMSTLWLETIDQQKAQKLIRGAPMYQGTIVEYREPVRDLDKEGKDAFMNFLDGETTNSPDAGNANTEEDSPIKTKTDPKKTYSEATVNAAKEQQLKRENEKVLLAKKEAEERSLGEYVRFICNYVDTSKEGKGGDRFGDSKCLAKWKEGFGWHDLKFERVKSIKKYEWETVSISNGVDGWSVVQGCFVNDSEKRSSWKSRIKICGRKPTASERKEIGSLWRGIE